MSANRPEASSLPEVVHQSVDSVSGPQSRARFPFVVVGHVDHGKSSLIGRLLHEAGALADGKFEELQAASDKRGMALEWSFALDALQAERDQAVTIDSTQVRFFGPDREYVVVDAPGHREFVRNMLTGAAQAHAAILVVAADDGIADQTRRHASLLPLIGLSNVLVAVTKMDLVGFSKERFEAVSKDARALLTRFGLNVCNVVPLSIRSGDGFTAARRGPDWYQGPALLDALDLLPETPSVFEAPPRLVIQGVQRVGDTRILTGRVATGRFAVGDEVLFSPSDRAAKIAAFATWPEGNPPRAVEAGQSVGIVLDRPLFVERGEVMSSAGGSAPKLTAIFGARLVWFSPKPLVPGAQLTLRLGTTEAPATVSRIGRVIDPDGEMHADPNQVVNGEIAEIVLRTTKLLAVDDHLDVKATGRFVLFEQGIAAAAGTIAMTDFPDQRPSLSARGASNTKAVAHHVDAGARAARHGHRGAVFWLTGLSGAGKSTLAMAAERSLFARGFETFVLDGDNLRAGLTSDLGFSPADRSENLRRVGEVAALFGSAGMVTITSLISPYAADRERARRAATRVGVPFYEIYVAADIAVCEARDPKGLYARARSGDVAQFTGISAPYETPGAPDLVIDTAKMGVDEAVQQLTEFIIGTAQALESIL